MRFVLTAGQEHDITQAEALMGDAKCERVVADKGYDSDAFREYVAQSGATAVIPPKHVPAQAGIKSEEAVLV